jgi:hypothetical protein
MAKTVIMLVYGDGDYGAMTFEQNYDLQVVYEEMVAEGVKEKTIVHKDENYGDEDLYVSLIEFGEVDMDFINFIGDEFLDYDDQKRKDFYIL